RTCGGGISRQQRRCRRNRPCKGKIWTTRYKICNPEDNVNNNTRSQNKKGPLQSNRRLPRSNINCSTQRLLLNGWSSEKGRRQ
ncbi:hypothetical protein ALC53_11308, partial [Atta colombica]